MSISSRKNYYLDRIQDDNKYANCLVYHVEKYIIFEKEDRDFLNQSITGYTKLKDEYEKEITDLRTKTENYETLVQNLEKELKDKEKELERYTNTDKMNQNAQREVFNGTLIVNQLKAELDQKDLELRDIIRQHELVDSKNKDTIKNLNEKIERQNETLKEYQSIKTQNERLNVKLKETNTKKDEYDELAKQLDNKNKQVDNLQKERNLFINEIDKLNKEIFSEKERLKNVEYEKRKLEMDLMDMKTSFKDNPNQRSYIDHKRSLNHSEIREEGDCVKLIDVGSDSMIFDDDRRVHNQGNNYYINQEVEKLYSEKEGLITQVNELKIKWEKENKEKEKITLQRDKFEIQIKRLELDNKKLEIEIERFENDNKRLHDDFNKYEKDKTLLEYLQNELQSKNGLIRQMLLEKKNLETDKESIQREYERVKNDAPLNIKKTKVNFYLTPVTPWR
jgi:chromosome segregation ATPase